ncbi:MAG: phospholipid carrier-dependent glycosyltransferase [Kiritimatiellae bacterium]|nr:phospholipid carrier-dependent glycosyltransferase [Kiritimatiellia bacterium]
MNKVGADTVKMPGKMQYSKTCLLLLILVCVGALYARVEGIKWPKLHPDEPVIGTWLEHSAHSAYIRDRVYPNGFFALARPFMLAGQALFRAHERFSYICGEIDRARGARPDGIYFGRWLNAWGAVLLCAVMFLLTARLARSELAGLLAAGLTGFAQYAVEHSHYAETDIAAVLTLAVALWFWVAAGDTGRRRWLIAAALASGFAAGTKFTLLTLAPVMLVESVLFARDRAMSATPPEKTFWPAALKWAGLGVFFFGAGFAIANPAVLLDFQWFWAGLSAEKQRVFAETALNLGPAAARPAIRYLHHLVCLHDHLATLGYPWLVLLAVGLPCAALGFVRRYGSLLLLFPLLYAVYWLFLAPWVRSQEFLLFLPSLAALAALPLAVLWRARNYFMRVFAISMACLALAANGYNGLRVSDLFAWKDTRLMAREWLQLRLPLESSLAAESYAEAACINTWKTPLLIRKVEQCGPEFLITQGADYLLRVSGVSGRGLRHPLTGELYPEPAGFLSRFLGQSELLCSWAPLPPRGLATFVSPALELYGLKRFAPELSLRLALSHPALIINADQNPVGRQTFLPSGGGLGGDVCLLIDRLPQTIAVGGPEPLTKPVYLVLNTAERPAVINIRGFGMRKRIALDPYDTAAVPLQRPAWQPRGQPFESITLQAEPVKDILYIPCFARIAFTVDEAARIFMETAREDRLAGCFSEAVLEKELNPAAKYRLATRLGLWPAAGRTAAAAAVLRGAIEQGMRTDPAAVSINGRSGYYYEQFARVRLQQPYDFACLEPSVGSGRRNLPDALKALDLQAIQKGGGGQDSGPASPYLQALDLPVLLGRGQYELRGELMLKIKEAETDLCVPLVIRTVNGGAETNCCLEVQSGTWREFTMVFRPGCEIQPRIEFCAPASALLFLKNMEIGWSLTDVLAPVRSEIAMAAIRHSLYQGDRPAAAAQLAALAAGGPAFDETVFPALAVEMRQMLFACVEGGLQTDFAPGADKQAAHRLLELLPAHYRALRTLAQEDEAAARAAQRLEGNLKYPTVFPPWLALVGFSFNAGTREAYCVFEVLCNETPGLAVSFWLQRRNEWRRKQVQSLTGGARLRKGERAAVSVRLNEAFGPEPDVNALALGIETDVLWHAGLIPPASGGGVAPFAGILGMEQQ